MLKDIQTDEKPDSYIVPCLRQAHQELQLWCVQECLEKNRGGVGSII